MARQVVKYQETTVTVERTISELSGLIKRYGGSRFEQSWTQAGEVSGVRFAIRHESLGELPVHLTARTVEIERILTEAGLWKSYPPENRRQKIAAQSYRITWRHIKDLTEQLLLATQLGIRTLPESFLADVEIAGPGGVPVRMAEYLEHRAVQSPQGLTFEGDTGGESGRNRALPMPGSGGAGE